MYFPPMMIVLACVAGAVVAGEGVERVPQAEVVPSTMSFPPMMIVLSCVAGAVVAFFCTMAMHFFMLRERSRELREEDNTDEATATLLEKSESRDGKIQIHSVTYEFSAERADGTPCTVRVFDRKIDDVDAWDSLEKGGPVQVLYLTGRPGSCRMKDLVESEASEYSNMQLIGAALFFSCIGAILSAFPCLPVAIAYEFVTTKLGQPRTFHDPVSRSGMGLAFFISFIVCSVLRAGQAYLTRNSDYIYDIGPVSGMTGKKTVVVRELDEPFSEHSSGSDGGF